MGSNSKAKRILGNTWKTLVLPAGVFAIFAILLGTDFVSGRLLLTIARQTTMPLLISMGLAMLMFMGMWDFSVGSVMYAAAILGANLSMSVCGGSIAWFCVFAILIGVILTSITGILYNLLKVPSLVLSIGMTMVYEALPRLIIPTGCGEIGARDGFLAQSPWCFIFIAVGFSIFFIVFNYTTFGHNVRAIGANQQVAHSAGISLSKIKFKAYLLCGLFIGMAAVIYMSMTVKVYIAANMSSMQQIFDSMMGVFLAMFLSKYCGFPVGLLVGVVTMRMLSTALVTMGMESTVKTITTGLFLLVILIVSANQGRFGAWKLRRKVGELANREYQALSVKR